MLRSRIKLKKDYYSILKRQVSNTVILTHPVNYQSLHYHALRSLISDSDIPLNDGCLVPASNLPKGSLLDPSYPAAVVKCNVEKVKR